MTGMNEAGCIESASRWRGVWLALLLVVAQTLPAIAGEKVRVTSVVDGDTIHVLRDGGQTTVRLIGVDAPETNHPHKPVQPYGPESTEFARRTLDGRWVVLEFERPEERDIYGRLLAYVFLEDGTFFNRELVRQGYARAFTRFAFKYSKDFRAAEREAQAAERGLWGVQLTAGRGKIVGNRNSHVYHMPGQEHYHDVAPHNRVYFDSEAEAEKAGYRRAQR